MYIFTRSSNVIELTTVCCSIVNVLMSFSFASLSVWYATGSLWLLTLRIWREMESCRATFDRPFLAICKFVTETHFKQSYKSPTLVVSVSKTAFYKFQILLKMPLISTYYNCHTNYCLRVFSEAWLFTTGVKTGSS